jgi:hypothetical protein
MEVPTGTDRITWLSIDWISPTAAILLRPAPLALVDGRTRRTSHVEGGTFLTMVKYPKAGLYEPSEGRQHI